MLLYAIGLPREGIFIFYNGYEPMGATGMLGHAPELREEAILRFSSGHEPMVVTGMRRRVLRLPITGMLRFYNGHKLTVVSERLRQGVSPEVPLILDRRAHSCLLCFSRRVLLIRSIIVEYLAGTKHTPPEVLP